MFVFFFGCLVVVVVVVFCFVLFGFFVLFFFFLGGGEEGAAFAKALIDLREINIEYFSTGYFPCSKTNSALSFSGSYLELAD